jgi:polar amino acid transport system substrate-binding protein
MTAERESEIDMTQAYSTAGLRILTLPPHQIPFIDLLAPLLGTAVVRLLISSFLVALLLAHVIYLLERRINPNFPRSYIPGVWEGFWWLITIVATGEYADKEIQHISRRIVTIAFWLLGVVFIGQFTANITSAITVQQINGSISGPRDLVSGKQVVTVANSDAANILTTYKIPFKTVPVIEDAYALLAQHQVDAVAFTAPILEYYAAHAGRGKAVVVGQAFGHVAIGIATPLGSPLRKTINEMIFKLSDSGVLAGIEEIWFGAQH